MRLKFIKTGWSCILTFLLFSCLDPYQPPVTDQEVNFLVVDGFVNTTNHTVNVTLSRALVLWRIEAPDPELNAQVILEEEGGVSYTLTEQAFGKYSATSPGISLGKEYRLYIRTQSGEEYRSKYITPLQSPPIDEVRWAAAADGIYILADTHDDTKNTRYYKWEFIETWSYRSVYPSEYKLEGGIPILRKTEDLITRCYKNVPSVKIHAASTTRLSEDRIDDFELTFIGAGAQKISDLYSISVSQFALSKEAYQYWEELKKTTETLGSLFDPQPSRVSGNINNINNADEPVIGYFDGGSSTEKRIFIRFTDLPDHLRITIPLSDCQQQESISADEVSTLPTVYLLTTAIIEGITVVGYNYSIAPCVDCRYHGGVTEKPDFWP